MKSFINFLLEGQAEIDSAIQRLDDIFTRREKLWSVKDRLEKIVNIRTKPQKSESPREEDRRKFKNWRDIRSAHSIKERKKFDPEVKKVMQSLSPDDIRGFLMTPDEKLNQKIKNSNTAVGNHPVMSQHLEPLRADKVFLDKFAKQGGWARFTRFVPPDALKDAADLMTVVRGKDVMPDIIPYMRHAYKRRSRDLRHWTAG
jgi:hypothetical protein